MRLPTSRVGVPLVYRGPGSTSGLFLPRRVLPANQRFFMVSDAGFEPAPPPPCRLGQSIPGGFCPVGKSRIYKRFFAVSCTVVFLLCPDASGSDCSMVAASNLSYAFRISTYAVGTR